MPSKNMQGLSRPAGGDGVGAGVGIGGVSTVGVAVGNTFSVGVTVGGSGTGIAVATSGDGFGVGDAVPVSGVDVSSGAWTVGVIVFVASVCGAGIGDGLGRGWTGSTRAMGVAGSAARVGEMTSIFSGE